VPEEVITELVGNGILSKHHYDEGMQLSQDAIEQYKKQLARNVNLRAEQDEINSASSKYMSAKGSAKGSNQSKVKNIQIGKPPLLLSSIKSKK
jgi:hypothetical protein